MATKPTTEKKATNPLDSVHPIHSVSHTIGCDPEFFFKRGNRIIGSELVFPKGTTKTEGYFPKAVPETYGAVGKFIVDGVQAELNPQAQGCRAFMCNNIAHSFKALKQDILDKNKDISICFDRSVIISKTELNKLDPNNQVFGCTPSFSAYPPSEKQLQIDTVDAREYRVRAAGGHIHLGHTQIPKMDDHRELVMLLDIIVGNTCVLIDRDKGNRERRKLYGRAGEYRLPPYGIEYRTLSNFWLHSSQLTSLVFGLCRLALSVYFGTNKECVKAFLEACPIEDIQKAINTNSYLLALKNYNKLEPLIAKALGSYSHETYAISSPQLYLFRYFFETVKDKGLEYFFPEDPLTHWVNFKEGHDKGAGFYSWAMNDLKNKYDADKQKISPQ